MKRKELERIMKRFEKEILPRFVSSLASKKAETNDYDVRDFAEYAYELYTNTRQVFLEMLEETHIRQIEPMTRVAFIGFTVANFNGALHPDHKFIFSINYIEEDNDYIFGFTTRELINAIESYIPEKAVPLIQAETEKDMIGGKTKRIKILPSAEDLLDLTP